MPFETETEATRRVGMGQLDISPRPEEPAPGFFEETVPAAFRTENEIGSALSDQMPARPDRLDEAFDPFDGLDGYEDNASSFVHANTPEDVAAVKRQIDRERTDRETMEAAGMGGMVAGMAAGVLSPINLIPVGGAAYRSARVASSALRGAATVGAAGAVATAGQEAILLSTQQLRTPTEAAINVAASTVMAGVLGGAVEGISAARRSALAEAIGRDLNVPRADEPDPMVSGARVEPVADTRPRADGEAPPAGRMADDVDGPGPRAANDDAMPPVARGDRSSVGASATRSAVTDFEALETSFGADRLSLDPLGRTLRSPAVRTRQTVQDLVESPVMFEKTARGEAVPIAVETLIKAYDAGLFRGLKALDDSFIEYRLGRTRRTGDVVGRALADATGSARRQGKLDYKGFREEVGKAMRRNDEHPDPAVAKAAKQLRAQVFEPLKQRAIQAGLLPEDVDVATADSYLNRIYDIPRIIAKRDEFTRIVGDWLEAEQTRKATIQADLTDTMARYDRVAPLQKKMAQRMATIEGRIKQVKAQATERDRYGNFVEKRASTLRDRLGEIEQGQSELAEYIDTLNAEIRGGNDDPGLKATLAQMEKDLRALKRKDRDVLLKAIERSDAEEARQAVADSGIEDVIKVVTGAKKPPKPPDLLDWLVSRGGLKDDPNGELRALGAKRKDKPGLFRDADGPGMAIDDALTEAHEAGFFPEYGDDVPTMSDLLNAIDDHLRGLSKRHDPMYQDQVETLQMIAAVEDVVRRSGVDPDALRDTQTAARFFDLLDRGRGLDDLEAETAEMLAANAAVPVRAEVEAVEDATLATRAALTKAMNGLRKAKAAEKAVDRKAMREGAREQEVAVFELNAERRRALLAERMEKAQTTRSALADTARMYDEQVAALRGRMEQAVLDWRGKTAKGAQGALERRSKAEVERAARAVAAGESADDLARLRSADREVDRAVRGMMKAETRFERQELDDISDQIADRIISTPEGRLPYDRAEGGPKGYKPRDDRGELRGPLKARVFMIPDEAIEGFLVNDIEELSRIYTRSLAPDVEIADRFGRVDMQSQIQEIAREYDQRIRRVDTEKERKALEARKQADIRDVAAMRDRLRNIYGLPADPQGIAVRASRAMMTLNLVRLLGGVTMASIPDVGRTVMVHGFGRTLRSAVVPMVTNLRGVKLAKRELQAAGTATDMYLQGRIMGMTDLMENYGRYSRFERGLQGIVPAFAALSSMNVWNVTMKSIAGMMTMSRTLEAADALRRGKISAKERRRLLEMGIPDHVAVRIAELAEQHGSREGGLWLPNTEEWSGPGAAEAVRAFRANLVKEVDRTIITPGQDKPLWLSTPLGRMLGQFKSFSMASQQRILVAGLQQRDMAALNGAILMVSLGMLSYHLRNQIAGRESSDDWRVWVSEGFDRSGLTGWLFEANNMAEKLTRGTVGVNALIGGPQMTRYASRGLWGAMLGPSAGLVEDVAQITGAASTGDWQESDTRAMRRLLPFQNVFYLTWLFTQMEKGVNDAFGVPMRAR